MDLIVRKHVYNRSRIFTAADNILYCTCGCENMYIVQSIHIWKRVQDDKKQERQKCPAGTRQTDRKNWGLVWRNRKKISQIIKDYFHLLFFLLRPSTEICWKQIGVTPPPLPPSPPPTDFDIILFGSKENKASGS